MFLNKRVWNPIGSRRHCILKSQFLSVDFYFVLAQFHIKKARFSLVFSTYVQFSTKIVVIFLPFHQITFFPQLKKSAHMLRSRLSTVFQVVNNRSTSTIDETFNLLRTKYHFLNNHQKIELPFDSILMSVYLQNCCKKRLFRFYLNIYIRLFYQTENNFIKIEPTNNK